MAMQLGLDLLNEHGEPDAEANEAGVLEPGQPCVSTERIEVDRNTFAVITIAHHRRRWHFGLQVSTATQYAGFCPNVRHASFQYRFQAVDEAASRLCSDLCFRLYENGEEMKGDVPAAAKRLLKKVHERFDGYTPSVEELLEIQDARMREDGTWWGDESAAA